MYKNKFREKLKSGDEMPCWVLAKGDPEYIEIAGYCGVDGIVIDVQHTDVGLKDVADMVRAAECMDMVPMIRVEGLNDEMILKYLDIGCMGVQVPDCESADDVRKAIDCIKYAPMGKRGLSQVRASGYGLYQGMDVYVPMANEETFVLIMAESAEAVKNIDEMCQVPGIDAIMIGTTDLAQSLGHPGQPRHPEVLAAIDTIVKTANKYGVAVGTQMRDGRTAQGMRDQGFTFATASMQSWLINSAKAFVKQVKSLD